MTSGATCVQRLDGSRDSAIHTKYRISQCSSSMRELRYPLPRVVFIYRRSTGPPDARRGWGARGRLSIQVFLGALRAGVRWLPAVLARVRAPGTGGGARAEFQSTPPARTPPLLNTFVGSFCCAGFNNDLSAGSPTETLLRLILPLNDKVQWTSRDIAGSEPPMCRSDRRSKGSLGHAFTVRIRTVNQNQKSYYPSVPHEISVLVVLILGHLRYLLTDVPPQPNSPPDNVFRPDRPAERALGPKRGAVPRFRFTE
ncbi:Regulator of rDNA transcription protein 15 [Capsicum baccatum]|uniref:Regulator of rDNA transcription protein 15 n=1 Tax=Capsicum baccatum TaxID=33114 RepID=A0A2G2UXN2_CAPBA|nr:Regulator of rDNA transcription protein 15 [Capsicum baccatum]